MTPVDLFIDNDNLLVLDGLWDGIDKTAADRWLTDGEVAVTVRVLDRNENELVGATWPIAFEFETGSNGRWRATIPAAVKIREGRPYVLDVAVTGDVEARARIPAIGRVRTLVTTK